MGTFRAMNETWRKQAHELITKTTKELVQSMGGEAIVHIDVGYPCVINDDTITDKATTQAVQYLDKKMSKKQKSEWAQRTLATTHNKFLPVFLG